LRYLGGMRTISICQDQKKLMAMRHFDFDLTDMDFVRYFERRTGVMISCNSNGGRSNQDEWFETCQWIAFPEDDVYRIIRAKMQDCWEIYQEHEMPTLRKKAA
jgi:hypothetical protein